MYAFCHRIEHLLDSQVQHCADSEKFKLLLMLLNFFWGLSLTVNNKLTTLKLTIIEVHHIHLIEEVINLCLRYLWNIIFAANKEYRSIVTYRILYLRDPRLQSKKFISARKIKANNGSHSVPIVSRSYSFDWTSVKNIKLYCFLYTWVRLRLLGQKMCRYVRLIWLRHSASWRLSHWLRVSCRRFWSLLKELIKSCLQIPKRLWIWLFNIKL